jgi:hypothetical protein
MDADEIEQLDVALAIKLQAEIEREEATRAREQVRMRAACVAIVRQHVLAGFSQRAARADSERAHGGGGSEQRARCGEQRWRGGWCDQCGAIQAISGAQGGRRC